MPIVAALLIIALHANAEIINIPAISQGAGVNEFMDSATKLPAPGRAYCSTLTDIPNTSLCAFSDQFMEKALARAVLWAEGRGAKFPQGRVYENDSEPTKIVADKTVGIDLKGGDLLAFYKAAQAACAKDPKNTKICLSKEEKEIFSQVIIPKVIKNPNYVLITAKTDEGDIASKNIVDHELYHARYFQNKNYRDIVARNWDELNDSDRKAMEGFLAKGYDPNDTDLKLNEFQAHSLDTARNIHHAPIGTWAQKLREDLFRAGLIPSDADPYRNVATTPTISR